MGSYTKLFINKFSLFFLLCFPFLFYSQNETIRVISPNGNEILHAGKRYSISWTTGQNDPVAIFYRADYTQDWKLIAKGVSAKLGSYSWRVPDISTNELRVKIVSGSEYDISDNDAIVSRKIDSQTQLLNQVNNVSAIRIMPLGNSITFDNRRNDTRPVEDKIGYRYPLYNLLKNAGYSFTFEGSEHAGSNFFFPDVEYDKNAGFPGITDDQLYTLLKTGRRYSPQHGIDDTITNGRYLNTYPTDLILLHIGTNGNNEPEGTNPIDVKNILDEIDAYEDSTGIEIPVFVARIINRVPNQAYVTTFNDNVMNMVEDRINNPANEAYPDKLVIVDMENISNFDYSISPDPNGSPGDMNDELHPNDKGFQKIAEAWFIALERYFEDKLPKINKDPVTVSVIEGNDVSFQVSYDSYFPVSIQWKENGIAMPGENDSILMINAVQSTMNNNTYSCSITNSIGSVESNSAYLFVTPLDSQITAGIKVAYNFNEQFGNVVKDISNYDDSLNLNILIPDNVNWIPEAIQIFSATDISSIYNNSKLFSNFVNNEEITIELWVKPEFDYQEGPARIITFSKNKFERNFGLMQNGNKYEFRLRTTSTDNNGLPSLFTNEGTVSDRLTHIVYTLSSQDTAKIYLNGELNNVMYLNGSFNNWDSTFSYGIGNEFIEDKPWLGTFNYLAIFDRALSLNEIAHNYHIGIDGIEKDLLPPSNLVSTLDLDQNISLNWIDNSPDEIGFILGRRASADKTFSFFIDLSENTTQYLDTTAYLHGTKYQYIVSALNNDGHSSYSNSSYITTLLPKPADLIASIYENSQVILSWEDSSNNEDGFIIERRENINDSLFKVIDSLSSNSENYVDTDPESNTEYIYRVYAYTKDTTSDYSNEYSIIILNTDNSVQNIPKNFDLQQNYPNPFNPNTKIKYSIPELSIVSLDIYDILGRKIKTLLNSVHEAGYFSTEFSGSDLSSGIYFYTLNAESMNSGKKYNNTKKLILIK